MTKKDYELIASAFKEAIGIEDNDADRWASLGNYDLQKEVATRRRGITYAVARMVHKLASQDPKFQYQTFVKLCGIED